MRDEIFIELSSGGDTVCYKERLPELVPAKFIDPVRESRDVLMGTTCGELMFESAKSKKLKDDRKEFVEQVSMRIAEQLHDFISRNDTVDGYKK